MDEAPVGGLWLVDKPEGPTSHDVIHAIRRRLPRGTRVGHAGTLDPFASGLLVVAIGRATRLLQFVTGHDKRYLARVRLCATSATGDPEGPVVPTGAPPPDPRAVAAAVAGIVGAGRQRVPSYSAVKVAGEPLHRRARRGEAVEPPERDIHVRAAVVTASADDGTWFDLDVSVSKGTYIRQIAVDLGEALGVGGYCERLRRLAVGRLDVAGAVPPDAVPASGRVDPLVALAPMPAVALDAAGLAAVAHGRPVPGDAEGTVALTADGRLVAVATGDGHTLRPKVVLA